MAFQIIIWCQVWSCGNWTKFLILGCQMGIFDDAFSLIWCPVWELDDIAHNKIGVVGGKLMKLLILLGIRWRNWTQFINYLVSNGEFDDISHYLVSGVGI